MKILAKRGEVKDESVSVEEVQGQTPRRKDMYEEEGRKVVKTLTIHGIEGG